MATADNGQADTYTEIDASASTGTITVAINDSVDTSTASYKGSVGSDMLSVNDATIDKAII